MSKRTRRRTPSVSKTKLLIPLGKLVDRFKIIEFMGATGVIRNPQIVLLHVVEAPSRTTPLDPEAYRHELDAAEDRLRPIVEWLNQQKLEASSKVVVARSIAEAIVTEANSGGYRFVFLMKRKMPRGWRKFFQKSVTERVIREAKCLVITSLVE